MEVNRESIDKILGKFTKTTKEAIKKSGDAVGFTKLRLAVSNDKTKIKDLKTQIGELVYNAYIGSDAESEDIEKICSEIKDLNDEIERMENEIAQIRNLIRCSKCGTNNESSSAFCKKCGAELKCDEVEESKADIVADAND